MEACWMIYKATLRQIIGTYSYVYNLLLDPCAGLVNTCWVCVLHNTPLSSIDCSIWLCCYMVVNLGFFQLMLWSMSEPFGSQMRLLSSVALCNLVGLKDIVGFLHQFLISFSVSPR